LKGMESMNDPAGECRANNHWIGGFSHDPLI
jgi:hypothetical protein